MDPLLSEGGGLVNRGHPVPPGIKPVQGAYHLHCPESIAVSFDHREQSAATYRLHLSRIVAERGKVHVHPGS